MRRPLEVVDEHEVQALLGLEAFAAVRHDRHGQLGADCQTWRWFAVHQQTEERAVAAAIVEDADSSDFASQSQAGRKAAAMTPGDQPRAAVDLLPGVEPCADGVDERAHQTFTPTLRA